MKINKDELLAALKVIRPGLANQETIEQSTCFAFMGDRVVTYNDEISISHPISGMDITGVIKAEQLYQFLEKVQEKEMQLKITDSEVVLKAAKAKAGMFIQKEITLPLDEIKKADDWVKLPRNFLKAIDFVANSASSDMNNAILTCVHITKKYAEASDGYQISRHLFSKGLALKLNALIPAAYVSTVVRFNPIEIALSKGWVHFRTQAQSILSCRIFEDKYPDSISTHLQTEGHQITFPDKIHKVLEKAMIFTKRDHAMDEWMEIILDEKLLTVKGKNDDGWFEETIPFSLNNGNPTSFYITPVLLKNILSKEGLCTLGEKKIKFEGKNWESIALLRLKPQQ